jgi:hypothetical protein
VRRSTLIVFATISLLVCAGLVASAAPPPGAYFNGFEQNTAGWFNQSGGTIHREPSGYIGSGYASGINSADGSWHARLGKDQSPSGCASGGGPQLVHTGPFTNWGGYSSIFPTGGYKTRVDIYLDVLWAQTHLDQRFDWASAVNTTSGMHLRDFVFNVGTNPLGFIMSASNNSTRCGAFPANPLRMPVQVSLSGWYTFEHDFMGVAGGPLVVSLRLINKATSATVGTWVLSTPTDIIGTTVGGNRYGWFVQNEVDDLAIDNSERTGLVSTANCEVMISDGGWITTALGDRATFGGNAKASATRETTGEQVYQDHGPIQSIHVKAVTVEAVLCDEEEGSAELHGRAIVDGDDTMTHQYRINLKDGGQGNNPDDMYGISVPTVGYASGDRPLQGGNINIRFR